ncbi:hypothetical protein ACFFJX_25480 [Pseudarcicella hirudinis]|uniref:hypothetical protein n=1 Tax=Pseudarcicella hirudinis TaxID=1079859 RepID=UPI0035E97972
MISSSITIKLTSFVFFTSLIFLSCGESPAPVVNQEAKFGEAEDRGIIENTALDEASGLVAGRVNPNMLWSHNDSGDYNRILIDKFGKGQKQFILEGAENRDWEDIAISGDASGATIYVGDIGDNNSVYPSCAIYRFQEPKVSDSTPPSSTIKNVEKISYIYPDGARDAECLMVDHQTKDIYILSKREDRKRLYRLPYPQSTTGITTAEFVGELDFSFPVGTSNDIKKAFYITAGDIAQNNQEIIIKSYIQVFYWKRGTNESIYNTLKRPAKVLPYKVEPQGEGICFIPDALGYYTISEESDSKEPVHLYFYARKQ